MQIRSRNLVAATTPHTRYLKVPYLKPLLNGKVFKKHFLHCKRQTVSWSVEGVAWIISLEAILFFFRLLSNAFSDFGSVGRKRKKKETKKIGKGVWN